MAAPHDLVGELDNSQCWALNTATEHPLANCIAMDKRTGAGVCQSDCDEELLITLTFLQKVRLSGLSIKAPKEGGPSSVKLYANRADAADFDSTKALPVTQELTLSPANTLSAAVVPLLTAKFPSVYKLTILIEANHDDASESTVIEQLAVHGAVNEIVGKRNDSAPKWSEDSGVEKYEKARG